MVDEVQSNEVEVEEVKPARKTATQLYVTIKRGDIESTMIAPNYTTLRKQLDEMEGGAEVIRVIRGREIKFTKQTSLKFF